MPTFKGAITQTELLEVVRHERETFGGEKVARQPDRARRRAAVAQRQARCSNAAGELVDPDGKPLFDADGKLADPLDPTRRREPAGSSRPASSPTVEPTPAVAVRLTRRLTSSTSRPTTTATTSSSIGGGPAGAATSYWLAEAGHDVVFVEKKIFPREKTCGDGLTPRAVHQLDEMGLADRLDPTSTATTACAPSPTASRSSCSGPSTRSTRATATSCAGATSTRWSPSTR